MAYWNLGIAYSSLYDFPKTIEFYQKNVSIAKEIGDKESEGDGYINLGVCTVTTSVISEKQSSSFSKV